MVLIKGYSIKWKKDRFLIRLIGATPKGKEKIIEIYFDPPMLEGFIFQLKKAFKGWKEGLSFSEDLSYIG